MTTPQELPVFVSIDGAATEAVRAVAAVVNESLRHKGFSHVSVDNLDAGPGEPQGIDSAVSILDLAKLSHPWIFSTPVEITYTTTPVESVGDDPEIDALDPETLRDLEDAAD